MSTESKCTCADGKCAGKNVGFERTRRITGYCAHEKRFNDAKRAEVEDRVKHQ